MTDTTLYVSLTATQINDLAKVGWIMQFITASNETGVGLAAHLMSLLKSNASASYMDMPVTAIVGGATGNSTIDAEGSMKILDLFQYLPHSSSPGFAYLWLFFAIFSFVMVVLRFYIRHFLSGGLKLDDWIILAAWALGATYTISDASLLLHNHTDRHSWDVRGEDIRLHWRAETYGLMLFFVASALYKTALILFYMELSPSKMYQRTGYGLLALVWIYTILSQVWTGFWCQPFGYWNDPHVTGMHCQPFKMASAYMTALFVWDLILDLAVLLLPMSIVQGLQLRSKDKVLLYSLLSLGCAVCICAAGRISMVDGFLKSNDQTRNSLHICSWTLIEVHLGIACASAPMLRRMFLEVFPILKSAASSFSRSKSSKHTVSALSATSARSRDTASRKKQRTFPGFSTTLQGGESMTEMTVHGGSESDREGPMVTTEVTQTTEDINSSNFNGERSFYDEEKGKGGRVVTSVMSKRDS